jgi:AcrR family transcriptional regulator
MKPGSSQRRRVPAQARSKERMERVLDAAERELGEVGYEAATMQSIAARAETSIGSLYQFFPNKTVLFDAIAQRYFERVQQMLDVLLVPEQLAMPWTKFLELAVDAVWAFNRDAPGAKAIWIQGRLTPELLGAAWAINDEVATRLAVFLGQRFPGIPKAERHKVGVMVVETISAMLLVAGVRGEPMASALIEETKVMLRRYLAGYVRAR